MPAENQKFLKKESPFEERKSLKLFHYIKRNLRKPWGDIVITIMIPTLKRIMDVIMRSPYLVKDKDRHPTTSSLTYWIDQ